MSSGKPPPPGLGKEGKDFREDWLRGQAFVLLSISEKHRWGDGAPTVGEGREDPPPTQRWPSQGRTAKGGLSGGLGSHSPGSLVLCRARPLPPRPAPHLLGRLGVKVRLQKRDGELDLPGAVVLLHGGGGGCGRAGGGLGAGAGALPLRSAPARPQPGALGSRLPAQRSRLAAQGTPQPPIGSAPAPPGPLHLPPPGALTPSWPRRRLPGVTAPRKGEAGVARPGLQ